jgi:protein-S-isoprenylcysteine O-methyltransferase Ste14
MTKSNEAEPGVHFGGPAGALALTLLLPLIPLYLVAAVQQHGGMLWLPQSVGDLRAMIPLPTVSALAIYGAWLALQAFLAVAAPGKIVEGAQLRDGTRLPYKLNGLLAFVLSLATVVGLLLGGVVRATTIVAELGPLITTATIFIVVFSVIFYFWGRRRGALERSTGIVVYDFFMGTVLNPRLGLFDFKFVFESRLGMASWGALAVILPWAQHEQTGAISTAMAVVSACQLWYVTDFFVFESNLLSMLDIIYENFGFMLAFGCVVWIPFTFAVQQQFLLVHPVELPIWGAVGIVILHLAGYLVFRDSNRQKQRFRRDPSRPVWGQPPRSLETKRGTRLLLSGWWGLSRHANYFGDLTMALSWCLTTGFSSLVPYFYFIYFAPLLINRERRDNALCKEKYGADWDEYCRRVRWRIVPFVY